MAGLNVRFASAIGSSGLNNERILVAVSGGIDSTTLLCLVCLLREQLSLDVHVAHVDHGLRDDSAADAAFVRDLSERYGAPFHCVRVDVRSFAREKGCGIEAAARSLRYDFLKKTAIEIGASTVLTGHTADDQIETVLMSIARGGSAGALAGIPKQRSLTEGVRVLRPLLDIHRLDVENFARTEGLEWVEDVSNREQVFLRNRVRHELIPHLHAILGPGIGSNIVRMAHSMGQLTEIVEELATAAECSLLSVRGGEIHLDLDQMQTLRRVIIDTLLRRHLPHLGTTDRDRLHKLVTAEVGSLASLSGGWQALRERRHIVVVHEKLAVPSSVQVEIPIDCGQQVRTYTIGHLMLSVQVTDRSTDEPTDLANQTARIDADLIVGTLHLRPWRSGDRINPEGMSGSKLVSDLLTDAKIPHAVRKSIHVIADDEGILWVCGLRSSRRAGVTDSTVRCLVCWVEPDLSFD